MNRELSVMKRRETDVVIIGAGPSGSSAAALIQRAGYRTLVLEKSTFPRFVIGESLLPRCMDLLDEAGLLEDVQSQGYIIKNGAVFMNNEKSCTFNFGKQFSKGWQYTYQVPRDDFDLTLARSAEKQGVEILWQHGVVDVDITGNKPMVTATGADDEQMEIVANFILDASGYGRVLPRLLDLEASSSLPVRESLFTHITGDIRPSGDDEGKIWICMLPQNSWLWIIPFAGGRTSVGLVAQPEFIENLTGTTDDDKLRAAFELEMNAQKRLEKSEFVFSARKIHGYSASVKQFTGKHFALLGNATEFLDPVFSSGVTLALESANRAAKTLIRQLSGETVDWDKEYTEYMAGGIETFRTYVNAWYDSKLPTIFFSEYQPESIRSQICSILAGYVWDTDNPCVREHERAVTNLAAACAIQQKKSF